MSLFGNPGVDDDGREPQREEFRFPEPVLTTEARPWYLRCRELEEENRELKEKLSRLKGRPGTPPPVELIPSMFTVGEGRSIHTRPLGRSASIGTQAVLDGLEPEQSDPVSQRVISSVLKKGDKYCTSELFSDDLLWLAMECCQIVQKENRLLQLNSPIYVFGDIHGNLDDLRFFSRNLWPLGMHLTAGKFLFLGDYVDRGVNGLEVVAYLLAQKIRCPHKVFLLRGNHEMRAVNGWIDNFGTACFLFQCKERFGEKKGSFVWEEVNKVFDRLPLAAVVNRAIFCVHGGIPRPIGPPNAPDTRLADIDRIPIPSGIRPVLPTESPESNQMAFDLLWADPAETDRECMLGRNGFGEGPRGGGTITFGSKAISDFLHNFRLAYIIRAHEATASGVSVSKKARVFTVFSTSKDHGYGSEAQCGCVLIDRAHIMAINRSTAYQDFDAQLGDMDMDGTDVADLYLSGEGGDDVDLSEERAMEPEGEDPEGPTGEMDIEDAM